MSSPIAIGPIEGDLIVYLDSDNAFVVPVLDKSGAQLDVEGYTAALFVGTDFSWSGQKLRADATVETDPDNAGRKVLQIVIPKASLRPGTNADQWDATKLPLEFPCSVFRLDPGAEKPLRVGKFIVRRARP